MCCPCNQGRARPHAGYALLSSRHVFFSANATLVEVVHDLDIKDGRYEHAETEGVRRMLDGIAGQHARDDARAEAAGMLFDVFVAGSTK